MNTLTPELTAQILNGARLGIIKARAVLEKAIPTRQWYTDFTGQPAKSINRCFVSKTESGLPVFLEKFPNGNVAVCTESLGLLYAEKSKLAELQAKFPKFKWEAVHPTVALDLMIAEAKSSIETHTQVLESLGARVDV